MRLFLILLLTCSQAIAPALHAHVGGEHYGDGAHLHHVLDHGHTATSGADIESIEGRVIGVALFLVSRASKVSSQRPDDANTTFGAALLTQADTLTLPLRIVGLRAPLASSIQTLPNTPYLLPLLRGPPAV